MQASPKAARMFTGAAKAAQTWGDDIWNNLCDSFRIGVQFTLDEARDKLQPDFPTLAPSTLRQYLKATLQTVLDQDGEPQIFRKGSRAWML